MDEIIDKENNVKFILDKNTIVIQKLGTYKGNDENKYPFAATYVEGNGVKQLWNYMKIRKEKTNERND
jgi:hypothetical protein